MHKLLEKNAAFILFYREHAWVAVVDKLVHPTVKALQVLPSEPAKFIEGLKALLPFSTTNYAHVVCGIVPDEQFFYKTKFDHKSKKSASSFFREMLKARFNIALESNAVSIVNAEGGADFSEEGETNADIVVCGTPTKKVEEVQQFLLDNGLYPERIELASLASIGGIMDYARLEKIENPILVVEMLFEKIQVFILNNKKLDVAHSIPKGVRSIAAALQKTLNLATVEEAINALKKPDMAANEPLQASLMEKVSRELKSYAGFYEVQTGQSIEHLYCPLLGSNLYWMAKQLSRNIEKKLLAVDFERWSAAQNIRLSHDATYALDTRYFNLFSLMGVYRP
ncbi:MAG: hypothetical protein A2Y14_05395 [Verrucomicrobia bacterium GWF2_51_19]|nr:MAG: hypothetical protein A2Y14_05395 [Verrucomicrobia bacterium GWF2_51_19]HCJ12444.1 hypothetical protein [Opitutae bacterium]